MSRKLLAELQRRRQQALQMGGADKLARRRTSASCSHWVRAGAQTE